MKSIIIFTTTLIFLLASASSQAQMIIDLSTGRSNVTGQGLPISSILPPNSYDDTWTINTPLDPPNVFNPIGVGTTLNQVNWGPGANTQLTTRLISPYMNTGGFPVTSPTGGQFFSNYIKTVSHLDCAVQTGTLVVVWSRSSMDNMYINGQYIGNLPGGYINQSWPLNASVFQGFSDVTVTGRLLQLPDDMAYHEWEAYLILETCHAELNISDGKGSEKSMFCMDEDILFSVDGIEAGSYTLELQRDLGNSNFSTITTQYQVNSYPKNVNLFDFFNAFIAWFHPNVTYRLKLTVNTSCGPIVKTKDFSFTCCNSSSFDLTYNGNVLQGKSYGFGHHNWQIYSFPPGNSGVYTQVGGTLSSKSFARDTEGKACYYVTLETSGDCPVVCSSKSICKTECSIEPCYLTRPDQLIRDNRGGETQLKWNPVANADHYLVEVIFNDPVCCGGDVVQQEKHTYVSQTTDYALVLPPQQEPFPGYPPLKRCYSIKVYAVCADGSLSEASFPICVQE
jgi:hypothetical protein